MTTTRGGLSVISTSSKGLNAVLLRRRRSLVVVASSSIPPSSSYYSPPPLPPGAATEYALVAEVAESSNSEKGGGSMPFGGLDSMSAPSTSTSEDDGIVTVAVDDEDPSEKTGLNPFNVGRIFTATGRERVRRRRPSRLSRLSVSVYLGGRLTRHHHRWDLIRLRARSHGQERRIRRSRRNGTTGTNRRGEQRKIKPSGE